MHFHKNEGSWILVTVIDEEEIRGQQIQWRKSQPVKGIPTPENMWYSTILCIWYHVSASLHTKIYQMSHCKVFGLIVCFNWDVSDITGAAQCLVNNGTQMADLSALTSFSQL